jgi:hypothetical protein
MTPDHEPVISFGLTRQSLEAPAGVGRGRPATTLTISLVFGVQLNLSIASATNETRAFPRVGLERRIQARELVGFSGAYWSE